MVLYYSKLTKYSQEKNFSLERIDTFLKLKTMLLTLLYILSANISTVSATETEILSPPVISAESAVLMDARTGIVLFSQNPHVQDYPASITKIMTTLLAIEYADGNYDKVVEFGPSSVFGIPRNSSHISMDVDETLNLHDALMAVMLASANEVSIAVAELISGSEEAFSRLMTERAIELGATGTNFANSSGLPHPYLYTTAYDMALIMREAIRHQTFIDIMRTRSHSIPPTERQALERPLNNTHRMIQPGQFFHEDTVGGKTGFTIEARHTLVTYARRGSTELIVVLLRNERNLNFVDTIALFEYGFALFEDATTFDFHHSNFSENIPIVQIDEDGLRSIIGETNIGTRQNFSIALPEFIDTSEIFAVADIPENLYYPIQINENVGTLNFKHQGKVIHSIDVFALNPTFVLSAYESYNYEVAVSESGHASSGAENSDTAWLVVPLALITSSLVLLSVRSAMLRRKRRAARIRVRYSRRYRH